MASKVAVARHPICRLCAAMRQCENPHAPSSNEIALLPMLAHPRMKVHVPREARGKYLEAPPDRTHSGCEAPIRIRVGPAVIPAPIHFGQAPDELTCAPDAFAPRRRRRRVGRRHLCRCRASFMGLPIHPSDRHPPAARWRERNIPDASVLHALATSVRGVCSAGRAPHRSSRFEHRHVGKRFEYQRLQRNPAGQAQGSRGQPRPHRCATLSPCHTQNISRQPR